MSDDDSEERARYESEQQQWRRRQQEEADELADRNDPFREFNRIYRERQRQEEEEEEERRKLEQTEQRQQRSQIQRRRMVVDEEVPKDGKPWKELLGEVNLILANPPFLPVPTGYETIAKRYGVYSSGGRSGESVLEATVKIAAQTLKPNGKLAVVTEFMNPGTMLLQRVKNWWNSATDERYDHPNGVVFTNEVPIDDDVYAQRRSDDMNEYKIWKGHLEQEGIKEVSPGLLFVEKVLGNDNLSLDHVKVPKTDQGSIWTPENRKAVQFHAGEVEAVLSEHIISKAADVEEYYE
eukprot:CAMPEP_0119573322 /NCGR_PEP_ID=MMETSP1352-20130426/45067_1 /TAXON_ID=265584 /ORGANISM="Stauroneis constricta, Strain CCMP1120" /LENGTH=293 /DNA_ID=CAMNT_0007623009 /DNA_START=113 /DNA_END=992 /DNA_ORIENTATION=-